MGGRQKTPKPAVMNRSRVACHSWQACMSKPRGVEACDQQPHKSPLFVSPILRPLVEDYHWGQRGWHTQPANAWRRPSSAPVLTMPGRQAKVISLHYEDSIFLPYYPVCHVLLGLQRHHCLIHHHHFLPTKMESPGVGSFLPHIQPRMAKGLPPSDRSNAQLPRETFAFQLGPELWRVGEDSQFVNPKFK